MSLFLRSELQSPWRHLLRPHTLTAAVMPVLIGTAMTSAKDEIKFFIFAAVLITSVLIQSAVNMFNEYFDYKWGLDTTESVEIGGVIAREEIYEKAVLKLAILFFAIFVLFGIYICIETSWWVAAAGSISMAIGYFYSGGLYPPAYTSFGELTAGISICIFVAAAINSFAYKGWSKLINEETVRKG